MTIEESQTIENKNVRTDNCSYMTNEEECDKSEEPTLVVTAVTTSGRELDKQRLSEPTLGKKIDEPPVVSLTRCVNILIKTRSIQKFSIRWRIIIYFTRQTSLVYDNVLLIDNDKTLYSLLSLFIYFSRDLYTRVIDS